MSDLERGVLRRFYGGDKTVGSLVPLWAQLFEATGGVLAGSYREAQDCSLLDWQRWAAWRNAKIEGEHKRGNK